MPTRRLPRSNNARHSALRILRDRKDATPAAEVPLLPALQTELDAFEPSYASLMQRVNQTRSAQSTQTALTTPLRNAARMWVSHGYQALINATLRGQFPVTVLNLYGLPNNAKGAPDMGSEQAIIDAFNAYEAGETARTASGAAPINFPAMTDINDRVDAFRSANLQQAAFKDALDNAQEDIAAVNPDADRLILRLWNSIEAAFDKGDKASMRRRAREWGVLYVPAAGETPTPEDYSAKGVITDAATGLPLSDVEVGLDGTSVSATTDSEGRYYLPFTTAGSYTLRASLDGYTDGTAPVTITDSTLPEVNLALNPEASEEE
jgi:hypothetical protein